MAGSGSLPDLPKSPLDPDTMPAPTPAELPGQAPRVTEARAEIKFGPKDAALRHDVHNLGVVVGELLTEQGGDELFQLVEHARRAAIARREGEPTRATELEEAIRDLSPAGARDFIRAFSTYFQAVNSAELVHRIRRRRDYLRAGASRQPGGLEDTLVRLRDAGVGPGDMARLLRSISLVPVFTAHPTEPTRRTILRRQRDIVKRLIDMQNTALTPSELRADLEAVRTDLTAVWQTEEHPTEARKVGDELEHILFFMTDVLYRVIPVFYETLAAGLESTYGPEARGLHLHTMVNFASWIGGDMVGRSEVNARTVRDTMSRQRRLVLDRYYSECRELTEKLCQSATRVGVSDDLLKRIREYAGHFPSARGLVPLRHREMPYRVFMRLIMARLQATYDDRAFPYESPDELLGDLRLIADSLAAHQGRFAGLFAVERLMRRVETFGFHFMALDIRQEAIVNREVVGRCLGEPEWLAMSAAQRAARLREALRRNESPRGDLDNESKRAVGIFQAIAYCRRRLGDDSVGPYIVSQAQGVDDVLSVLLLARWGELRRRGGTVPLDIAPAFETRAELEYGSGVLRELLADPVYREHLEARGRRQSALVGYVDASTEVDLCSARWSLQGAQASLMAVADEAGIELQLIHGRESAIAPGGGKTHAAILSAPPGTIRGPARVIEQGELMANKYGVRAIALRTLEQAVAAIAVATRRLGEPPAEHLAEWAEIMETLCAAAGLHYRLLLQESPGFPDYFRLSTPVDVIERMRLGGSAAETSGEGLLAAPGAVPWVFAWAQSRNTLPAWYGFGSGVTRVIEKFGLGAIQEMVDGWHFFRTLVADVEFALAKSDLDIAARYSHLAGELHERFFPQITDEFRRSEAAVLRVTGQRVLLENNETLRRSIRLRNPYVDPMSILQVHLLRRWRSSGRTDPALFDALIASVNGIARALQDSG